MYIIHVLMLIVFKTIYGLDLFTPMLMQVPTDVANQSVLWKWAYINDNIYYFV